MALHYGGDGGPVSGVHNSRASSATVESEIEPLLSYYPDIATVVFNNVSPFKVACMDAYDRLVEGRGCPYLAFLRVPPILAEAVDVLRDMKSPEVPEMTLLYDKTEEILIAKFMVFVSHELVRDLFGERLTAIFGPSVQFLVPTGSNRFYTSTLVPTQSPGRSKDPDISFMPRSRDVFSGWPSLVVEVGASESLSGLRGDLKYWLRNSNGTTRVAFLLHINMAAGTILIERWEAVPRVQSTGANVNNNAIVQMAEAILLDAQIEYNGPSLSIAADQVFDNVPATFRPRQFTLTAQDLDYFNNEFWCSLHRATRRY